MKLNSKILWTRLLFVALILLLINVIGSYIYTRLDLTSEKRFSLSPTTKKLLSNMKSKVYVKVYLDGELQSGFLRLRNSAEDILKEMSNYSDGRITYDFVNPIKNATTEDEKVKIYQELAAKGLNGINLKLQTEESYKEQLVFPCLNVSIDGRSEPVNFLEQQIGYSAEEKLNNSIIGLEYKIGNAIKKLTHRKEYNIAIMQGHGEYSPEQLFDMARFLEESKYNITAVDVSARVQSKDGDSVGTWIPPNTNLLIIARPTKPFSDVEKYRIDQFVMNGGKILWAIDAMDARLEYIRNAENMFMAHRFNLNLDDLLFKYGVRINPNLIQDAQQSAPIPLMTTDSREPILLPWLFNPLLTPSNKSAIGRNLDPILSQYASSMDLIENDIKKTVILSTSQYGRAIPEPVRVHLGSIKDKPDFKYFKQPNLTAGVLLEGKFNSLFKNRLDNEFVKQAKELGMEPKEVSVNNRMIILSDADIIRNEIGKNGETYPMGYEPYSREIFGNKAFILNCIEYLLDDENLLEARNKEIKVRLLDAKKAKQEAGKWQLINLIVPFLFVVIFAIIYRYVRVRKWSKIAQ